MSESATLSGKIVTIKVDEGYCFIRPLHDRAAPEVFAHVSRFADSMEWGESLLGATVQYTLGPDGKRGPVAKLVWPST